jgi:hypothetical protein
LNETKGSSTTFPVLAGLSIGIGLIGLFAVVFNGSEGFPTLHFFSPYANAQVTLEGMKEVYSVGDSIDFSVTSKGYFRQVCSDYYPMVSIENIETGETVWSNFQAASGGSVVIYSVVCDPDPHYEELQKFTWAFGSNSERNDFRNTVISKAGSYELNVKLDNKVLRQEFLTG